MSAVQIATRVEESEREQFEKIVHHIGMTPAAALKVFIRTFNQMGGFPFELRVGSNSSQTEIDRRDAYEADVAIAEFENGSETAISHSEIMAKYGL